MGITKSKTKRRKAAVITNDNFEQMLLASAGQAVGIAQRKRKPARVTQISARDVEIPKPPVFHRGDVVRVRAKLQVSQQLLGDLVGRSASAVRAWELEGSGKEPDGSAARLLEIFDRHPELVREYVRPKR